MVLKLCARCGKPTPNTRGVCERCLGNAKEAHERYARYDKLRDPKTVKFYHSAAWKTLRLKKLQLAGYRCEACIAEVRAGRRAEADIQTATDVHHRVPLTAAWSRRLDLSNLKADCAAHHNSERRKGTPPGAG